jgi:adhesin/invasin
MLAHTARRNARGVGRLPTALACLSATIFSTSCDKVPLLAPTGSVITLFATATTVPSNGSMEIVATVIEQGQATAPTTPTTPGNGQTPTTPTTPTSSSSQGAGTPVHNGTVVTFTTTIGRIEPAEARTNNGQARVTYYANGQSGTATITAFSGGASGKIENLRVGTAAVERLRLSASPQNLPPTGGSAEIQARPEDASGNVLPGVPVSFSADFGTLSNTTATTDSNGVASTRLTTTRNSIVTARAAGQEATLTVNLTERSGIAITPPTTPPNAGQPTTIGIAVGATANVQEVIVDFGDGKRTSLGRLAGSTNISHTYEEDGTYTVTATAIAADGTRESVSTSITVLAQRPLQVSLTASPACAVRGTTRVTFSAATSGGSPTGYTWNFGGGLPPGFTTGPTTQITYPAGAPLGQNTVTVTVTALDAADGLALTTVTIADPGGCTALSPPR